MDRYECLRQGLDKSMRGVEIGPFFSPIVPKADGWQTIVVDYSDGEELRERARKHVAEVIRSSVNRIEDVDAVWRGEPIDELCLPRINGKFDYVVASHVIEHTPDILGFLQACSRLLSERGVISLAVPDMRKEFDVLKSPTNTSHILEAFRLRRTRHTPETVFEARSMGAQRNGEGAWVSGTTNPITFAGTLRGAWELYQQEVADLDNNPDYIDAHAWYFVPASFRLCMLELNVLDLIDFKIDSLVTNPGSEFIVQLRRGKIDISDAELEKTRLELALARYAEFHDEVFRPATK